MRLNSEFGLNQHLIALYIDANDGYEFRTENYVQFQFKTYKVTIQYKVGLNLNIPE